MLPRLETKDRRLCLLSSFALVLALALAGRAACARAGAACRYISDTIPHLPHAPACALAAVAAALFCAGMQAEGEPGRNAWVAGVAAGLALTVGVTVAHSHRGHLALAFLSFAGLLLLLTADLRRRPRHPARARRAGAALLALWLAFLLQLACCVRGWRAAGAWAQAILILGAWAYVAVLWFD